MNLLILICIALWLASAVSFIRHVRKNPPVKMQRSERVQVFATPTN